MNPTYEQFHNALVYPMNRPLIGLVVTDSDAESLLGNDVWARRYFDQWSATLPPVMPLPTPPAPTPALMTYLSNPAPQAPTPEFDAGLPPAKPVAAKPKPPYVGIIVGGTVFVLMLFAGLTSGVYGPSTPDTETATTGPAYVSPFTDREQTYLDETMRAYSGYSMSEAVAFTGADSDELIDAVYPFLETANDACDIGPSMPGFREGFLEGAADDELSEAGTERILDAILVYCATM